MPLLKLKDGFIRTEAISYAHKGREYGFPDACSVLFFGSDLSFGLWDHEAEIVWQALQEEAEKDELKRKERSKSE